MQLFGPDIFMVNKKKLLLTTLIAVLVAGNVFFGVKCFLDGRLLQEREQEIQNHEFNRDVVGFLNLFIEKVLRAQGEVSFEDRLQLENSVRSLKDDEILGKWEAFSNSATEAEAQQNVKDLLQVLAEKIYE